MYRLALNDLVRPDDPLERALLPPPDESPEDRDKRIQEQLEALRISREIDDSLLEARRALENRKKAIKILLLGQAESGKSTTLKNFLLSFCPAQFRKERAAWRMIIQLNLIRSVRQILQILQQEWDSAPPKKHGPSSSIASPPASSSRSISRLLTDNHRRIRMRLSPLLSFEDVLTRVLFPTCLAPGEISVRGNSGWKSYLSKMIAHREARPSSSGGNELEEVTIILSACREDIITLWNDAVVHQILRKHEMRLDQMPGFFLNDVDRIAVLNYQPTDKDIMRARIKTVGVEEHRFVVENGPVPGSEMYIYDVGGSRGMRSQWASFFDDMQCIIFLAPLTFNLSLEEDAHVNRIEDSISIWKSICANRLLEHSILILFLNKMDILQDILDAGVRVKDFVPSYGDQPNEIYTVVKYFRNKFRGYHKNLSPHPRPFICHETSVIDTTSTSVVLFGVREGILRAQLHNVHVL